MMFQVGNIADFSRMLEDRLERARTAAGTETVMMESQFTKAGSYGSSRMAFAIEQKITPIHETAIGEVMRLMIQFSQRTDIAIKELLPIAKTALLSFTEQITARMINSASRTGQAAQEFHERFNRRVESAIRDIEIGFIQGESVVITKSQKIQVIAMRLLQVLYNRVRENQEPIWVVGLKTEIGLEKDDVIAAWRYLKDKRLIDTFNVDYTARINRRGIEAIENAQHHPDQTTTGFPSVTMNIGTVNTLPLHVSGDNSRVNINSIDQSSNATSTKTS